MIAAKTDMQTMPENCCDCEKRLDLGTIDMTYCDICNRRYTHKIGRPEWCPLVSVDETLPAQLAAAEARCVKLGRLLDAND